MWKPRIVGQVALTTLATLPGRPLVCPTVPDADVSGRKSIKPQTTVDGADGASGDFEVPIVLAVLVVRDELPPR